MKATGARFVSLRFFFASSSASRAFSRASSSAEFYEEEGSRQWCERDRKERRHDTQQTATYPGGIRNHPRLARGGLGGIDGRHRRFAVTSKSKGRGRYIGMLRDHEKNNGKRRCERQKRHTNMILNDKNKTTHHCAFDNRGVTRVSSSADLGCPVSC